MKDQLYVDRGCRHIRACDSVVPVEPDDEEMWCFAHSRIPDNEKTCMWNVYRGECDVRLAHLFKAGEDSTPSWPIGAPQPKTTIPPREYWLDGDNGEDSTP